MTPKRINIPSDLVLKVALSDLYDEAGEAITIEDVTSIELTFLAGGSTKTFTVTLAEDAPSGVSLVTPEDEDPYLVVCLCTDDLQPGQLSLTSKVTIPDTRFHDGARIEVDQYLFPIILV